jgi:hypothetical protein
MENSPLYNIYEDLVEGPTNASVPDSPVIKWI